MLLKPFRILYELFVFALQAAFLYGLALIAAIALIAWAIVVHREPTTVKEYVTVPATEVVEKIETVKETVTVKTPAKERVCKRIEGCETFPNAPNYGRILSYMCMEIISLKSCFMKEFSYFT